MPDAKQVALFPPKAEPLFKTAPYKVMYGGRGGSKTWDFCRALLILGSLRKLSILCCREIQKSIAESVHKTLATQIDMMGMNHLYRVLKTRIVGNNGTEFIFAGLRNDIQAIKSMEGVDICAVFEATFVSENSWRVLLPTIRRDPPFGPFGQGSEVWVEFNPELASDYTWKFWVLEPPEGTVVIEINWRDNEWFPEILRKQKNDMRKRDYEAYLTTWEGRVRRVLAGAIYAKEMEAAEREKRINPKVLVDRSKPVDISCDLGRADTCALTFWQQVGMQHNAVDCYGNFGYDWSHYLQEIQNRKYIVGRIYLPHDAANEQLAASKSIKRQTMEAYPGDGRVITVPRTSSVVNDINAVRYTFPRMWFNEVNCSDLLTALAHYRFEVDPDTKEVADKPLHDWASHFADSARCYVMGLKATGENKLRPQRNVPTPLAPRRDGLNWMNG
jgi:phage terminase large subunit